jgi:hypothetical protein
LFFESIPPQHGYIDIMDASRDGQYNMPMPGTALLDLHTPDSTPTATLHFMRPPPENFPLDVIRLHRAGDSQRNANGRIPGRRDVLQHKTAHATARRFRPPGYFTALRTLMFPGHETPTRRQQNATGIKSHLATIFQK